MPIKTAQQIVIAFIRFKLALYDAFSTRKAGAYALNLFLTPVRNVPKKIPAIFKEAEKITMTLPPYELVGYRWNHPHKKKVMILHGFSSTIMKFDHFVKPLIKQGYEVIAIDAPAHGKSTGKQVSVLEYKAMIKKANEAFGPMDAYIAHSFGGLALSLYLSENHHDKENKIVLIAPATETSTAIRTFCKFLKIDDEVKKAMEEHILEKSGIEADSFSISRVAASIKGDILWIHDEDDEITPWSDAKVIAEMQLSNFRFMLTKELGHRKIYRDNKVKKAIEEFLKQDNVI
ncbi:MAG: alpha/beta hydrolase [Bacteroidota bacterium]